MTAISAYPTKRNTPSAKRRILAVIRPIAAYGSLIAILIPFIWMVSSSLKPAGQVLSLPVRWIPEQVTFGNFSEILNQGSFLRYILNSVILTVATVALTLLVASPAAYAISRMRFTGRRVTLIVALFTQFIPPVLLLVPLFIFWSRLDLLNSYTSLTITYTAFVLAPAVFILASFFNTIPFEIEDAAAIDGCSQWQTFRRIILPLAKPGLLSAGVWVGVTTWQEFVIALALTSNDEMRTLPVGLFAFIGQFVAQWNLLLAGAVLASVPIAFAVFFLQRHLVEGITSGAMK